MSTKIFPFLLWFRDYDRKAFQADFVSGITVALVLIPQSMAYAQLAGRKPTNVCRISAADDLLSLRIQSPGAPLSLMLLCWH